jgi:hypothetical protein
MTELLERGELLARLDQARAEGGRPLFVAGIEASKPELFGKEFDTTEAGNRYGLPTFGRGRDERVWRPLPPLSIIARPARSREAAP